MFATRNTKSYLRSAATILALIYYNSVRSVRKTHRNAVMALVMNMLQVLIMLAAFYLMFSILGLRGASIRGDFLLYLMTGIFMFISHIKTQAAVMGAEGPTSAMMKHLPMNTAIAITSAALGALYIQALSVVLILFVYNAINGPIEIQDPVSAIGMFLLAWFSGVAVGLIFLAIKPWAPSVATTGAMIYRRVNMLASGKMFVANALPSYMIAMFDWNPLFHIIDQTRGFVFINYNPHYSNVTYPIVISLVLVMLGLLGEFYTRKHASMSWDAGR